MGGPVRVQLLGDLEAVGARGEVLVVRGAKQRLLLAVLAIHRGGSVSVDRLADVLWGEQPPGHAGNALQVQVAKLRGVLGPEVIATRPGGYAFTADLDVDDFEHLVDEGQRCLEAGDASEAARLLRQALALCRGEPLSDFAFADFAQGERTRLQELRLTALESRIEADLAVGRASQVVGELEALCTQFPLRERFWGLRMTALYRAGRQADALRTYAEARGILAGELGLEPGPELRRLEAMILVQDPALDARAASPAADQPRLPHRHGNLPASLTRFVGRRTEMDDLSAFVAESRLVTLVGPGGAGKSRLAVEVASVVVPRPEQGTWLVELAPVVDAAGVAPAIATAVGLAEVHEPLGGARTSRSIVEALVAHLAGQSLLLVVDNCEHLVFEAAAVIEALLRAVPGLRVLATSREALSVPGEAVFAVGPLGPAEALELFVDRARSAAPGAELTDSSAEVAEDICRQLDGMPLAIELAAARLRALPLAQLAQRLDNRFEVLTGGARTSLPRHQTLRAVVDWSFDLLFEDEKRLFSRLTAFVGPFGLDDVEAVCADDELPRHDIVELLLRLVDKSLVTPVASGPEAGFILLQTLWQYGRERLESSGEAQDVLARHAARFRQLAEDAREGLRGPTGPARRELLTARLANLRVALDWHIAGRDAEGALALTTGMAWLWFLNGDFREGRRWVSDALGAAGHASVEAKAKGRAWNGYFICMGSNPTEGTFECESAAQAVSASDDDAAAAEVLLLWAVVLMNARQLHRAVEVLVEAQGRIAEVADEGLSATYEVMRGWSDAQLGKLEEAEQEGRACLTRLESLGEIHYTLEPLNLLAAIAEARGDLGAAADAYQQVVERCRQARLQIYEPFALLRLAAARARQGDDRTAEALFEEARVRCVSPWLAADAMVGQAAVVRRLGEADRALELLETARRHYEAAGLDSGRAVVDAALAWWQLTAGSAKEGLRLATEAVDLAARSDNSAVQLAADSALAAAVAVVEPTKRNVGRFLDLANRRSAGGLALVTLTDDRDIEILAAQLPKDK